MNDRRNLISAAFTTALLFPSSRFPRAAGSTDSPPPIVGGFTLDVSGGTLNDGSGVNGLSVLATLSDSGVNTDREQLDCR